MPAKDLKTRRHTCVYARKRANAAPAGAYVHPVGAYGVVGFSGVKDARKSVFNADASASAGFWRAFEAQEFKEKAEPKPFRRPFDSTSAAFQ
jgi:hypothetical protein